MYSGRLLPDHLQLKDILRKVSGFLPLRAARHSQRVRAELFGNVIGVQPVQFLGTKPARLGSAAGYCELECKEHGDRFQLV